jgi:hypothetical protein
MKRDQILSKYQPWRSAARCFRWTQLSFSPLVLLTPELPPEPTVNVYTWIPDPAYHCCMGNSARVSESVVERGDLRADEDALTSCYIRRRTSHGTIGIAKSCEERGSKSPEEMLHKCILL